ncbi:LPD7 domain-containing protein [Massilia sp. R2A-15]|uniref:LPD7 domain-containing protein n=1 Tax=Massilia sp. R2A-15 TaxID=3064278 RepID=UPI0027349A32|nr:LPD7 domain-containing protein [Massilia sp. R2A-15]WLI91072.1 LPD7 domain-containing protein [Massilia sp. R2A-15]
MNTIDLESERAPALPDRQGTTALDIKEEQQRAHGPTENTPEVSAALSQARMEAHDPSNLDSSARIPMDSASPDYDGTVAPLPAESAPATSGAPLAGAVPKEHEVPRGPADEAHAAAPAGANIRLPGAEAERISAAFVASLEARMAKSGLEELGWRDRTDLAPVLRDLEVLAGASWRAAANLWDKYRPDDPDKPIFIDADDKDPAPHVGQPESPKNDEPSFNAPGTSLDGSKWPKSDLVPAPAVLARRYLVADNKFYFRDDPNLLAFEDKGKRIATEHNDPLIARSMVELAEAKQWTSIRVKGTDEFRREVWLAASLREIEVEGYTPHEVDKARLTELRAELQPRRHNAIEQGRDRTHSVVRAAPAKQDGPVERRIEHADEHHQDAYRSLSKQQRVAVDTLRAILTERGDSAKAVAMASELATERFQQQRVYVGRLLEHGRAPYEHNPDEKQNYFVTIKTIDGDRTIWGVDLERAIGVGGIKQGDDMALVYRGRKRVTITDQVRDRGDQTTQKPIKEVNRNAWEADKLDRLRAEALERVRIAAKATEHAQPMVPVYDLPPRLEAPHPDKDRKVDPTLNR